MSQWANDRLRAMTFTRQQKAAHSKSGADETMFLKSNDSEKDEVSVKPASAGFLAFQAKFRTKIFEIFD
jgi:hypothetical protein